MKSLWEMQTAYLPGFISLVPSIPAFPDPLVLTWMPSTGFLSLISLHISKTQRRRHLLWSQTGQGLLLSLPQGIARVSTTALFHFVATICLLS